MDGESLSPEPQELEQNGETQTPAEIANELRYRIPDPDEFRDFSSKHDVKSGKWGNSATESLEAFHEKYSNWPGQEEEDREINEYLGFGKGSIWETKAVAAYREMFPGEPLEQEKWEKAARLVKRGLKDARRQEYKRHEDWTEKNTVQVEKNTEIETTEKLKPTRVNAESQSREDRPNNNEDSILVDNDFHLYGVFDGMGGEEGGEQASREAVRVVTESLETEAKDIESLESDLKNALISADKLLAKDKIGYTTATIAKLLEQDGQTYLIWAHIGDTRLYLLREGEGIQQITTDGSVITEAFNQGRISSKQAETIDQATRETQLNEEMKQIFKQRNLTDGLGSGQEQIESGSFALKPGDRIIMTSDGIHDNLTKSEIEAALESPQPAENLVRQALMYSKAGHFRSKRDDMSAVVVEFPPFRDPFEAFQDETK